MRGQVSRRSRRKPLRGEVGLVSGRGSHAAAGICRFNAGWTQMEEWGVFDRSQEWNQPSGSLKEFSYGRKTRGQMHKDIHAP